MSKLNEIRIALPRWRPLSEAARRKAANIAANLVARLDLVTDWRLQKSYYLAEVWSIEERIRRLSDVEFASWTHGPWSLHVREAEEALEAHGLLVRARHQAKRRPEAEFFQIPQRTKLPQLEGTEVDFLDSFAAQIKYTDGDTLTKIAKATVPFQSTKPRELVDLEGYLESLKKKHERFEYSRKVAKLVAQAKAE